MTGAVRGAASRPTLVRAARALLAALILGAMWLAVRSVAAHWDEVKRALGTVRPQWSLVAVACASVVAAYALLIESWRRLLAAWNAPIGFGDAARIWSVSNLARYIPGAGWQMGAMAALGRRAELPVSASSGAAIVSAVITLAAGCAVTAVCGASVLALPLATRLVIYAGTAALLFAAPLVTAVGRLASRFIPALEVPTLTHRMVATATLLSAAAWIAYGVGFLALTRSLFPEAPSSVALYTGVYTGAYIVGYVAFLAPAGLGPREATLGAALAKAGLGAGAATLMPLVARLWTTAMEVGIAALFLAADALTHGRRARR